MLEGYQFVLVGLAAIGAGFINALAGGGTLLTFPVLVAAGLPPVSANITNTVALVPGYLGGVWGQRADLSAQKQRLLLMVPAGVVGGLAGGMLLRMTSARLFADMVPFLILLASALLALQEPLKKWLTRHMAARGDGRTASASSAAAAVLPLGLAAVYSGYFGAGSSVIILAVLGLVLDDQLTRLNALKQAVSFVANLAAALFFVFSGLVVWPVVAVMTVGALLGGSLGGRLAGRIRPVVLRLVVVGIGTVVGVVYLLR